ncbi:HAD superfamily protein, hydrolase 3-type [Paracholeplasma brassicae]|uniref:HAD superfamily protein, hydrolase 3-type n=1 Tax=Acholeplasma brassicae TaxID=61635 RepID=U4KSV9_9MOLU|nr:HAD-IIB family hydrolase [Paracholeplasma brassicae]CCV65619.1 HAD superfamily protein, hydrolase 3-type [Paracholeplasma brassicae]
MKRAVFFDVDGTLFDNKNQCVPRKTVEVLKKLKEDPTIVLGLATGRSHTQLDAINEVKDLFDYRILINGALAFKGDEIIYENKIDPSLVAEFVSYLEKKNVATGYVGLEGYSISMYNESVQQSLDDYQMMVPKADKFYYQNKDIYQMWIFDGRRTIIEDAMNDFSNLTIYPWHKHGADVLSITSNKGNALNAIRPLLGVDQVICFGDGLNDFELIQNADIGVVMNNSRSDELKKLATLVAKDIDQDGIYHACVELGLIK